MSEHAIHWPAYAHIPGCNTRHPEGAFDAIRDTAQAGMTPVQLAHSAAFCTGRRFIGAGFYWEAHEVLEPVWMMLPDQSRERQFVQGLIQIANGFLKLEMGRPKAALRLVDIARALIGQSDVDQIMGVNLGEVHDLLEALQVDADYAL